MVARPTSLMLLGLLVLQSGNESQLKRTLGPTPAIESMVRASKLIFVGRFEKLRGSNLSILPASDKTAIVLIEKVLDEEKSDVDLTGRRITLVLLKTGETQAGQQAVFFTNGLLYGDGLAVQEVGRVPVGRAKEVVNAILKARQEQSNEALKARFDQAALVVLGKVTAVRKLARPQGGGPRSEHDPDWWVAEVQVQSVIKGSNNSATISVAYPNSNDVMWYKIPKYRQSQQGIWMLQIPQKRPELLEVKQPIFVALNPLDFQQSNQLPRIRQFLTKH